MSNKEFYGIWLKEAEAAVAAIKAGAIQAMYKVPGKPEVVVIVDAATADDMDRMIYSLPLWKLGYAHIVTEFKWTPLRPYENWFEDLQKLAQE
jgi:hypothetical protein